MTGIDSATIDEKDVEILVTIGKRKTANLKVIEEETGIPTSTVNYRVQNLREAGILGSDLFELDLEKLGLSVTVITEVFGTFEEGYHSAIGDKLANIEGVNQVYFTMGDTDFIVISHLHDREMVKQLVEQLERIDEVQRTSSKFVIEPVKRAGFPIGDFHSDTLHNIV